MHLIVAFKSNNINKTKTLSMDAAVQKVKSSPQGRGHACDDTTVRAT